MKCFRLPFSVGLPRAQCTLENPRTVTAINPAIMHPPASWPAADLTPRLRDVRGRPTTYAKRRSRGGGARCQSAARRCDYGFCMRHFRYSFQQRGSRAAAASPACRPMTAASAIRAPNVYSVQVNIEQRRDGPAALPWRRVARGRAVSLQRLLGTGWDDTNRRTRFDPRHTRQAAFPCAPPSDSNVCSPDTHARVSTGVQCIKAYCSRLN